MPRPTTASAPKANAARKAQKATNAPKSKSATQSRTIAAGPHGSRPNTSSKSSNKASGEKQHAEPRKKSLLLSKKGSAAPSVSAGKRLLTLTTTIVKKGLKGIINLAAKVTTLVSRSSKKK